MVMPSGSGDKPNSEDALAAPVRRSRRTSHQPQGISTTLAPTTRQKAMSKGDRLPPRDGSAEARATTMKEVQINTVISAATSPMVRGEKPSSGGVSWKGMAPLSVAG